VFACYVNCDIMNERCVTTAMYGTATQPVRTVHLHPAAKSIFAVTSLSALIDMLHQAPSAVHVLAFLIATSIIIDGLLGIVVAGLRSKIKSKHMRDLAVAKVTGYAYILAFATVITIVANSWYVLEAFEAMIVLNELGSYIENLNHLTKFGVNFGEKINNAIRAAGGLFDVPETTKRVEMSAIFDSDDSSPTVTAVAMEQTTTHPTPNATTEQGRKGGSTRERNIPVNSGPQ